MQIIVERRSSEFGLSVYKGDCVDAGVFMYWCLSRRKALGNCDVVAIQPFGDFHALYSFSLRGF